MQLIRGNVSGCHTKSNGDKYGRYTWMKLGGKNNNKLCIITAYRVFQEKGTQLSLENCNTSYWQQVKLFINNGTVDPDPRNQVLKDFTTFIDDRKVEGYKIIPMMDANESAKAKNSKVTKCMERKSLHDIHKTTMRNLPITTRLGSRRRINFIFSPEGFFKWYEAQVTMPSTKGSTQTISCYVRTLTLKNSLAAAKTGRAPPGPRILLR